MWRADSLEKTLILGKIEGKRRRGQQSLDRIANSMDMILSNQEIVEDRGVSLCRQWACKESDVT